MSGLCGWFGCDAGGDGAARQIAAMAEDLTPLGVGSVEYLCAARAAVATETALRPGYIASEGDTLVAIEGYPYWDDDAIQRRSAADPAIAAIDAFRKWGPALLEHLHGPFSVSLWDGRAGYGLLAIDRMGIHAMCYAEPAGGGVVFGSSADAVRQHPGVGTDLSPQSLYNYLLFYRVPAPRTIYRDQKKLAAGFRLELSGGETKVSRYWRMPYRDSGDGRFDDLKQELRERLGSAVRRTIEGEAGAVGAFLSGGLDSSTVVGTLAEVREQSAKAYTIGFDEAKYDESEFARIAAGHFGAAHNTYRLTAEDTLELLPRLADALDEPLGNSSVIPAYYCARMASEDGIGLLLAGDGGDEIFAGNSRYAELMPYQWYNALPAFLRMGVIEPLIAHAPGGDSIRIVRRAGNFIRDSRCSVPDLFEKHNPLRGVPVDEIFSPEFAREIDPAVPLAELEALYDSPSSDVPVHRMMHLDLQFALADNDLRKVVKMADLAGIRVRFPMLDEDLVAFSARVPPRMLLRGRRLRHFFKQAMVDFLPRELVEKKKHGFGMPFSEWLREHEGLRDLAADSLSSLKAREILRPDFLDRVSGDHGGGAADGIGGVLWDLLVLELWLQRRLPA